MSKIKDNMIISMSDSRVVLNMINDKGQRPEIVTSKIEGERVFHIPFFRQPVHDWKTAKAKAIRVFLKAGFKSPALRV